MKKKKKVAKMNPQTKMILDRLDSIEKQLGEKYHPSKQEYFLKEAMSRLIECSGYATKPLDARNKAEEIIRQFVN